MTFSSRLATELPSGFTKFSSMLPVLARFRLWIFLSVSARSWFSSGKRFSGYGLSMLERGSHSLLLSMLFYLASIFRFIERGVYRMLIYFSELNLRSSLGVENVYFRILGLSWLDSPYLISSFELKDRSVILLFGEWKALISGRLFLNEIIF